MVPKGLWHLRLLGQRLHSDLKVQLNQLLSVPMDLTGLFLQANPNKLSNFPLLLAHRRQQRYDLEYRHIHFRHSLHSH